MAENPWSDLGPLRCSARARPPRSPGCPLSSKRKNWSRRSDFVEPICELSRWEDDGGRVTDPDSLEVAAQIPLETESVWESPLEITPRVRQDGDCHSLTTH